MKKFNNCFAALFCLILVSCSGNAVKSTVVSSPSPAPVNEDVHQELISHPTDKQKNIEFYWSKPEGKGPWPVIVYIHGHQSVDRPGGRDIVDSGMITKVRNQGVVVVSVSQPGYGHSDGAPDYCGTFTQDAVLEVIRDVRGWNFVKADKIGVYGINQGATVASMVIAKDNQLAAAVLIAGIYDLQKVYEKLSDDSKSDELAREITRNIKHESGATEEAFKERSVMFSADKIKTPTLILAGALDDRSGPEDAEKLAELISKNGVFAKAVIYPKYGHSIPMAERKKVTESFFKDYLGVNL
jgi:dipeptidyl aminopeptidase/acylaminoacyl peptidase